MRCDAVRYGAMRCDVMRCGAMWVEEKRWKSRAMQARRTIQYTTNDQRRGSTSSGGCDRIHHLPFSISSVSSVLSVAGS